MSITHRIESSDKQEVIYLTGYVDENADFSGLNPKPSVQLVIDLAGVEHLNSLGLRTWVNWVKKLDQYPGGIFLRRCPNVVVHQMNILEGFIPLNAVVESLEVPFLCDACGHSFKYWAERGRDYKEAAADQPAYVKAPNELPCVDA